MVNREVVSVLRRWPCVRWGVQCWGDSGEELCRHGCSFARRGCAGLNWGAPPDRVSLRTRACVLGATGSVLCCGKACVDLSVRLGPLVAVVEAGVWLACCRQGWLIVSGSVIVVWRRSVGVAVVVVRAGVLAICSAKFCAL